MTTNIAFAWNNLFDAAVITASSAALLTPPATLQQQDVARKWRGVSGNTESITATWSADQTADTFAVMGVGDKITPSLGGFLLTGTVRLQLTSAGGATGDVYNPAAAAGMVDPNYGYAIHLLTPKTFRSATWTFSQAGASYIEAGRGFVGNRVVADYNPAIGSQRRIVDPSSKKKTDFGLTKIRVRPGYRTDAFELDWVSPSQRWSLIEAMDLANGAHVDVLIIFDTASTNLGRDSIWGLFDQVEPVTSTGALDVTGRIHRRTISIEERL